MPPNPTLMAQFGTDKFYLENLEKKAGLSLPLKLLGAAGTAALMSSDSKHRESQAREAQLLNQMFQQLEAQRQEDTKAALSGKGRMLSPQGQASQQLNSMGAYRDMMSLMDKRGSATLAYAAAQAVDGMDKEAIGALFGGLAQSAGKALGQVVTKAKGTAGALKGAPKAVAPKVPGVGGTQGVAQAAQAAKAKKPLIGWKTKAVVGAGALGTAYTGYKGMQAARDYMMAPTYTSNAWGGGGMLRGGVNQYGYTGAR